MIQFVFWLFAFIVFYTYIGYGVLLYCINKVNKKKVATNSNSNNNFEPAVAIVIPAYNEEKYIPEKIKNTLSLHYPAHKLHIYFVTDGSTDSSANIISQHPQITLLHQPTRCGKAAAMNRAMQVVTEPFVVFCDANTELNANCIKEIVKHYENDKVGGVAGEKKIFQSETSQAAAIGEGFYWKYESFLKKQDANFYSVVGAAGDLFSIRSKIYEPVNENSIIEDFVLSLTIAMKGYIIKYEPKAYAIEKASTSIKEEKKRKIRISAGAFQAMVMLKGLLNIFRYGRLSFQYISHRVLRWSITPLCLFLLFPLNIVLVIKQAGIIYKICFISQLLFYLLAILAILFTKKNKIKILYIPYYFIFMNIAVFLGLKNFLFNKQSVLWEKIDRAQ